MSIRIAEHAGFCFGVKRATGELEREIKEYGGSRKIYTLGRIIHNDHYVEEIKSLGVREISREDIPSVIEAADRGEEITVVIRAHGELKFVVDALTECDERNPAFKLLDCTCPYVRKVRRIAEENSGEGKLFLLLGSENHPEVEGIMSCTVGEGVVLADSEAVKAWVEKNKDSQCCEKCISIAAQTTQNLGEWQKSIKFIKKVYTNALIFDTICNVTQLRQEEALRLARESDVMIVIGSRDSSNSRKLCDISREHCREVYFISDTSECPKIECDKLKLSITAGASTPFSLIQEVYKTMNEQNENFAELLESSFKTLNTGEIVEGVITSISQNEIHLDLGAKTTGVIVHDKATDDPQAKL
ncbi:MAG: 4-hydroxy-3-methylbut-2-enyl diphosphate reductase, partial [Ruminococcaceae bacterium]|nr:4-hydroxy-3-methylbut-2-enyl diphosphate reductase [Oscillospiraceae bacterium]